MPYDASRSASLSAAKEPALLTCERDIEDLAWASLDAICRFTQSNPALVREKRSSDDALGVREIWFYVLHQFLRHGLRTEGAIGTLETVTGFHRRFITDGAAEVAASMEADPDVSEFVDAICDMIEPLAYVRVRSPDMLGRMANLKADRRARRTAESKAQTEALQHQPMPAFREQAFHLVEQGISQRRREREALQARIDAAIAEREAAKRTKTAGFSSRRDFQPGGIAHRFVHDESDAEDILRAGEIAHLALVS